MMVYAIYALTRKSPILLYQLLLVQDRWSCASNILFLSARSPILSHHYPLEIAWQPQKISVAASYNNYVHITSLKKSVVCKKTYIMH